MTRDDIIKMAHKAGFNWPEIHTTTVEERLERFFTLAYEAGAAAEREACADLWQAQKLTDEQISDHIKAAIAAERNACAAIANEHKEHCYDGDQDWYKCRSIEAAIRARGDK